MKRGLSPTPFATPNKRHRLGINNTATSSPVAVFHTPLSTHSAHSSSLYRTPADSPTNPFGRTLPPDPELPPPTSFSRHLPLRFQVVFSKEQHVQHQHDDVYRIVQVPLNYTFTHLRAIISWLFDIKPCGKIKGRTTARSGGHLFRAHKGAAPYKLGHFKPGAGKLVAKLSSVRDPYARVQTRERRRRRTRSHSRSSCSNGELNSGDADGGGLDEVRRGATWDVDYNNAFDAPDTDTASEASLRIYFGDNQVDDEEEEEEDDDEELDEDLRAEPADEGDDWRWEAEESYTLLHVFPYGGDQECGIIYEPPSGKYEVHISLNTVKIPSRRGRSNTPYVFQATGHIHHDDDDLAPNSDDEAEVLVEPINPAHWNERRPFTTFLSSYYASLRAYDQDEEGEEEEGVPLGEYPVARALFPASHSTTFLPTPPNTVRSKEDGETNEDGLPPSSPPAASSPLPFSSPAKSTRSVSASVYTSRSANSSSYSLSLSHRSVTLNFPAETPLPKHKLLRKRLDKATSWIKKHIKVEKEIVKSERKEMRKETGKDLDKDSSEGSSEDEGGLESDGDEPRRRAAAVDEDGEEEDYGEEAVWGDDIELEASPTKKSVTYQKEEAVEEQVGITFEEDEEDVDELSSDVDTDTGDGWRSWDY